MLAQLGLNGTVLLVENNVAIHSLLEFTDFGHGLTTLLIPMSLKNFAQLGPDLSPVPSAGQ